MLATLVFCWWDASCVKIPFDTWDNCAKAVVYVRQDTKGLVPGMWCIPEYKDDPDIIDRTGVR